MEQVILVDADDNPIGTMEKMQAHREGRLHRAFSILIFNTQRQLLIQKRAVGKYHSAGLWTNTCCSHPQPSETMEAATRRRLRQELGIDLQPAFEYKFIYRAALGNNLTEHELDYVFSGTWNKDPVVDAAEISDWKYIDVGALRDDIMDHPEKYTHWFKLIVGHPQFGSLGRRV